MPLAALGPEAAKRAVALPKPACPSLVPTHTLSLTFGHLPLPGQFGEFYFPFTLLPFLHPLLNLPPLPRPTLQGAQDFLGPPRKSY